MYDFHDSNENLKNFTQMLFNQYFLTKNVTVEFLFLLSSH